MNKIIVILLTGFTFGYAQKVVVKDSAFNKLSEVIVTTKNKTFTNKNGNIKVDIAKSIYNFIPNTVDLLSKLPNIQISADRQSIGVVGRGNPLLYIDNQKVGMNDLKYFTDSNALSLAIKYSFGKIKNGSYREKNIDENAGRIR
jgi:hypothetical protein